MVQPTPYDRQNSFALFSAENPNTPHRGTDLDAEFNAIKISLDETQSNLSLIQDDDGQLARASVGRAQLDSSITIGFKSPVPWAPDTAYTADIDTVFYEAIFYSCVETHTSGVSFDPAKWFLVADLSAAAALPDGGVTEAKIADGAVTVNKIGASAVSTSKIASSAVTTPKIQDQAVTSAKIANEGVITGNIAPGAVTSSRIGAGEVQTANIAADAVTLDKLVNASAQYKILARKSASAGDFEECSLSEVLDFVTGAARGDILFRGASLWQRLAAGTVGHSLLTGGAGADPSWGKPGVISAQTAAVSSDIRFTNLDGTYREYVFDIDNLRPGTNDVQMTFQVSTDNGSTWKTTGYLATSVSCDSSGTQATNQITTAIGMSNGQSTGASLYNGSGGGWSGQLSIHAVANAASKKIVRFSGVYVRATTGTLGMFVSGGGYWNGGNDAINAVRFIPSSGNWTDGTVTMRGVRG